MKHIEALVERHAEELISLALKIHAHPELGMEEHRASTWQTELLETHGFDVMKPYFNLPTAYRAEYRGTKDGPTICFLSEYDALPELGHGCGHNLIAMVGVGAALASKLLVDKYGGRITIIGSPAEETAGTKVPMAAGGVFSDVDVVMMAHPGFRHADCLKTSAMDAYQVEFFGKAAHAASAPHEGINALDAMILFFNSLGLLRQQMEDHARVHGVITHGGDAANIIPDYTAANLYVRSNRVSEVKALAKRIRSAMDGAALATGCTAKMSFSEENFKDTQTNNYLNELAAQCIEEFTAEALHRYGDTRSPGSSDLGDVSYVVPAIQMVFKIGEYNDPEGGFHTQHMVEAAASEEALQSALQFMRGLVYTTEKLLTEPEHLRAIKEEFLRTQKEGANANPE